MLLVIHNLPSSARYADIKSLIQTKCGLTDVILDNLVTEENGSTKKVTVGLADEGDAAILVRKINGIFLGQLQLYVEDVRQKKASEQPYRSTRNLLENPQPDLYDPNDAFAETNKNSNSQARGDFNSLQKQTMYQEYPIMNQPMGITMNYGVPMGGMYVIPSMTAPNPIMDYSGQPQFIPPLLPQYGEDCAQEGTSFGYQPENDDSRLYGKKPRRQSPKRDKWSDTNVVSSKKDNRKRGRSPPNRSLNARDIRQNHPESFQHGYRGQDDRDSNLGYNQRSSNRSETIVSNSFNDRARPRTLDRNNKKTEPIRESALNSWSQASHDLRGEPAPFQEFANIDNSPMESSSQETPRSFQIWDQEPQNRNIWNDSRQSAREETNSFQTFNQDPIPNFYDPRNIHEEPVWRDTMSVQNQVGKPVGKDFAGQKNFGDRKSFAGRKDSNTAQAHNQNPNQNFYDYGNPRREPNRNDYKSVQIRNQDLGRNTPKGRGNNRKESEQITSNVGRRGPQPPQNQQKNLNVPGSKRPFDRRNDFSEPQPKKFAGQSYPKQEFNRNKNWNPPTGTIPNRNDRRPGPVSQQNTTSNWSKAPIVKNADKKPNLPNVGSLVKRDQTWRAQSASHIAKDILKNLCIAEMGNKDLIMVRLKADIKSRIEVMLNDEIAVPMNDIISRYRVKYPPKDDQTFFLAVLNKIKEDQQQQQQQQQAEGTKEAIQSETKEVKAAAATENAKIELKPIQTPVKVADDKPIEGKLPKYPNADKQVYKQQKQIQKKEMQEDVYALTPELQKAVDEECDTLCDLFMAECVPEEERDTVICEKITDMAADDFRKIMRLQVTKRVLNVTNSLLVRIYRVGTTPPKREALERFLKKFGAATLKKCEGKRMFVASLRSFKNFDRLCKLETADVDGVTMVFDPLHIAGPPPKVTKTQITQQRNKYIQGQIDRSRVSLLHPTSESNQPDDNSAQESIDITQENIEPEQSIAQITESTQEDEKPQQKINKQEAAETLPNVQKTADENLQKVQETANQNLQKSADENLQKVQETAIQNLKKEQQIANQNLKKEQQTAIQNLKKEEEIADEILKKEQQTADEILKEVETSPAAIVNKETFDDVDLDYIDDDDLEDY